MVCSVFTSGNSVTCPKKAVPYSLYHCSDLLGTITTSYLVCSIFAPGNSVTSPKEAIANPLPL